MAPSLRADDPEQEMYASLRALGVAAQAARQQKLAGARFYVWYDTIAVAIYEFTLLLGDLDPDTIL